MSQEAIVRTVITDTLTSAGDRQLLARDGRDTLKERILAGIKRRTDVAADKVLFMDLAVV